MKLKELNRDQNNRNERNRNQMNRKQKNIKCVKVMIMRWLLNRWKEQEKQIIIQTVIERKEEGKTEWNKDKLL